MPTKPQFGGSLSLTVAKGIEEQFRKTAKKAFPKETLAYLLGTLAGDHIHIDELYYPDDLEKYCGVNYVDIQPHWISEAMDVAKESGLTVVGDQHSHPYKAHECNGMLKDRSQSEQDLDRPRPLICGITVVQEIIIKGRKTLRASTRYWGPTMRLEVTKS